MASRQPCRVPKAPFLAIFAARLLLKAIKFTDIARKTFRLAAEVLEESLGARLALEGAVEGSKPPSRTQSAF